MLGKKIWRLLYGMVEIDLHISDKQIEQIDS